jgi:hypothetical protein
MRTWAKGTSRAAVLTAGFVALGVSAIPANAFADVTNGSGGVLSGNQVDVPISAPVDVSGNGAALLGTTHATSRGGAKVHKRGEGGRTSGAHGIASGNQVNAPISLPVNACGNGAAVLGEADAGCRGGAKVNDGGTGGGRTTDGTGGVLAGNQVHAPISIPVNVCGNAVAVAGEAVGGCEGGATVKNGGDTGSGQETSGVFGVGAGNQADIPISVPVDVCGNAVGNAAAACEGGASVRNGGHRTGRQTTTGDLGVIAGNQGNAPVSIPLTVCGNAAALAGQAGAFCEGGAHARSSSGGGQHTSGAGGILAGNQGNAPISIPAEVCGNAAAVVGLAGASCNGQTLVEGSQGSGGQTSGGHGAGNGNQANAPVKAPADVCGNAAAIVGLASALCEDGSGYGGYEPYSRTTGTGGLPASKGLPTENALPKVEGVHGLSKLVAVPTTDGRPMANARHGESALPGSGAVSLLDTQALPGGTGLPKLNGRHTTAGKTALPKVDAVNGLSNALPKTEGLAEVNVLPAVGGDSHMTDRRAASGLPATNTLHQGGGANGLSKLVAVPRTGGLPGSGLGQDSRRTRKAPLADGTLAKATNGVRSQVAGLPAVGRPLTGVKVQRPNVRSHGASALPVRQVTGGRVLPATPVSADDLLRGAGQVPVTSELGPVKEVAAKDAVAPEANTGSVWVLAVSGVLAFAAGTLALTRRLRVGRR